MRHQQLFGFSLFFLILGFALPAFAGNWGENWGEMMWGSVAAVPTLGWLGLVLLLALLVVTVFWKMKRVSLQAGVTLSVLLLVPFLMAPHITTWEGLTWYTFINGEPANADQVNQNFSALTDALDVTVPNSFANSGIADANEINSNFETLKTAVDTFTNNMAAATSATDTAFANGSVQGAASVDITSDNAAVCTTAGGTYDAGTDSCAVDITTDNAAAEAVAAAAAGSAACTQAGGTWDAGTSTCTPASGGNQGTTCGPGELWDGVACVVPQCDVTVNDAAIYDSGFAAGVLSVDIRTDNGALCTSAGGTYDSGTNTCTVDITSDNNVVAETTCTNAGGTWAGASCIGAPTPQSNDETVCTSAGGTWVRVDPQFIERCMFEGGIYDTETMSCSGFLPGPLPPADLLDQSGRYQNRMDPRLRVTSGARSSPRYGN